MTTKNVPASVAFARAGINSYNALCIAAEARVCMRTVGRVYAGGGKSVTRKRVVDACQRLRLPEPPDGGSRATRSRPSDVISA